MKEIFILKVRDNRASVKGTRTSFDLHGDQNPDGLDPMLMLSARPEDVRPDLVPGKRVKLTIETLPDEE